MFKLGILAIDEVVATKDIAAYDLIVRPVGAYAFEVVSVDSPRGPFEVGSRPSRMHLAVRVFGIPVVREGDTLPDRDPCRVFLYDADANGPRYYTDDEQGRELLRIAVLKALDEDEVKHGDCESVLAEWCRLAVPGDTLLHDGALLACLSAGPERHRSMQATTQFELVPAEFPFQKPPRAKIKAKAKPPRPLDDDEDEDDDDELPPPSPSQFDRRV